ncbi:MAG: sugar hydrolase [Polyangiaceae bacterium]|nr:sugar hydrolase [Polyangiaceae bacterium]
MNGLKRAAISGLVLGLWSYGCGTTIDDSGPAAIAGQSGESIANAGAFAGAGAAGGGASGDGGSGAVDNGRSAGDGGGGVGGVEVPEGVGGDGVGGDGGDCDSGRVLNVGGGGDGGVNDGALRLASIDYVSPYVAYLGEQQSVIIRGAHFPKAATVCFGKQRAVSVEVRSSTEIRATPPPIHAAGRVLVTLGAGVDMARASAELVVRPHPSYVYTSLVTDVGFQDRHVLYDAERDAVFSYCSWFGDYSAKTPSTINRYGYDDVTGAWTMTSSYVPELWDIGMSPDGQYLLALGTDRLWLLDPLTLSSLGHVDFARVQFGTAGQLGVANDGQVLLRDLGKAYSLVHQAFTPAAFPGGIGIIFSADGSRGVVGDANTSATIPLSIYDASTGHITPSQTLEYFQLPSLDRTGSRYFSGGNLRDASLSLIGGVPTYMGYMRPDGRRAYEVDGTDRTRIHTYDLTGDGPSFPKLADLVAADAIDGYWLHASLDSRFMFAPGPRTFVVLPLP